MAEEKKAPIDFLKVVEGIKKDEVAAMKEAFKAIRTIYLEMIEAGFSMEEAMVYIAALTRQTQGDAGKL